MPAFQPQFQGDEHPAIGKLDELAQTALLTLKVMQRAASTDKQRLLDKGFAEVDAFVDLYMSTARAFQR
jgi:hypothetical protein